MSEDLSSIIDCSYSEAGAPDYDKLPDNIKEVYLTAVSLREWPKWLAVDSAKNLTNLVMRQNYLVRMNKVRYAINIKSLDLYDNKIEYTAGLKDMNNLESLDLSFNSLKTLGNPDIEKTQEEDENMDGSLSESKLPNLKQLYLIRNDLKQVNGISHLAPSLTLLELGDNRIKSLVNSDILKLTNLEQLWIGKNKLKSLEGIENLSSLKILSVTSNRLRSLDGIENLVNLEELYASDNGIEVITGLEGMSKLKVLDISDNKLEKVSGVKGLTALQEFWANSNPIASTIGIESLSSTVVTVYFEHCSFSKILSHDVYLDTLKKILPNLKQIDADILK